MDFKILQETSSEDGSIRLILEIKEADLIYLGYILETMEGCCNYTTISKSPTQVKIDTNEDYITELIELLIILEDWHF